MSEISIEIITGQTQRHLARLPGEAQQLHSEMLPSLMALQQRAAQCGFTLAVASGFRSFDRQLAIWNAKARGERPVLDYDGNPLNVEKMSPLELVHAIMRWSALPGASRHHWGSDFDVWDRAAVAEDYQLQLVPEEYQDGGPFAPMSRWLDEQMQDERFEFFRPYRLDRGGIAPEPWHLSYRPLARQFDSVLTPALLVKVLTPVEMALKETVLDNIDFLFERYIQNICDSVES
ncbi:M15 family metallopeptidase [Porticoccaceae bacterium LTM1]|nr:M15 family metallopeptidase [Porticoccaceae bacterium LTM1]